VFFSLMSLCRIASTLLLIGLVACSSHSRLPHPVSHQAFTPSLSTMGQHQQPIALLLPLHGPLAKVAQSVKKGFFAAADESETSPHIILIDTGVGTSMQAAYSEALAKKARIIVGPLLKSQVQNIASLQSSIPILALNYLNSDISTPSGLYQLGLSPQDEVQQVTQMAWNSGKRSAIIITVNGHWGTEIGKLFAQQWQVLGGIVVDHLELSKNPSSVTQQLRHFLHFKSPHTRRMDFDVLFLVSNPQFGRQIKPLLKFFYAGNIPVYATASIYSGIPSQHFDTDLNQIIFCAAPWSLGNWIEPDLYQQLKLSFPLDFNRNSQYYALGVDAFHIIQQFERHKSSQKTLQGTTGILSFNTQRRIVRQLPCAQFHKGYAVPISQ